MRACTRNFRLTLEDLPEGVAEGVRGEELIPCVASFGWQRPSTGQPLCDALNALRL